MKKKVLSLALVVVLALVAIGSVTLAYFTDTDTATNTFTFGKVDITLNETFDEMNAKLLPGSQTKNAIQKEVYISVETGSEDAYVWYTWAIPAVLDSTDGSTGTNNIVHVNSYGGTWDKYYTNSAYAIEGINDISMTWDHDPEVELGAGGPDGFLGTQTIDGIVYNVYLVLYHGVLSAGQNSTAAMKQVYLDSKVDTNEDGKYTINGKVINYDFSDGLDIIVNAYGIQAAGFADVYEAYQAFPVDGLDEPAEEPAQPAPEQGA